MEPDTKTNEDPPSQAFDEEAEPRDPQGRDDDEPPGRSGVQGAGTG